MKSEDEIRDLFDTYTFGDYKKMFDEAINRAEVIGAKDEKLHKWIIRTLADVKLYYKNELTDKEVVQLSQHQMVELNAWKSVAKEMYGITFTDEEVDQFISEGPDTSDFLHHYAYAEALGLPLKKLNHDYDRDLHERNVIWFKLQPVLEEKYGSSDQNTLLEKFKKEVR